jgi:hypothetical protein
MTKKVGDLDDDAMRRIANRTRELMRERFGGDFEAWTIKHAVKVAALARCTWLATREEIERDEK